MEYSQVAFDRAQREGKPLFLLFTAEWCHWCHVYEQETLEQPEVADTIARHFVPVVVNADARQDLMRQYGARGLPTTVIFSPEGKKLFSFAGHVRKADLLATLERFRRDRAVSSAEVARTLPTDAKKKAAPQQDPGREGYARRRNAFLAWLEENYDPRYGGFGAVRRFRTLQKFPKPRTYLFLLEETSGDPVWLGRIRKTLDRLARGLYDAVEGGFYRYSVHEDWMRPHYEKMLPTNAALIQAYLRTFETIGDARYRDYARGALAFVLQKLHDPRSGGFFGSQAADEEYFPLDRAGRARRTPPPVSRDQYANWNAEMVLALLEAARVLKEPEYGRLARRTLDFLRTRMLHPRLGVLHHRNTRTGRVTLDGQLEDNAWVILAFAEAYRVTGDRSHLNTARRVMAYVRARLYDPKEGAFYERRSESREAYRKGEAFLARKPFGPNALLAYALARTPEVAGGEGGKRLLRRLVRFLAARTAPAPDEEAWFLMAYRLFLEG